MIEVTLQNYEGPGLIAGVPVGALAVTEHAQGSSETVERRWWEVSVEAARGEMPDQVMRRIAAEGSCSLEVPGKDKRIARALSVALVDGRRWQLELRGEGRSPLE